jgi:hypothetical protein
MYFSITPLTTFDPELKLFERPAGENILKKKKKKMEALLKAGLTGDGTSAKQVPALRREKPGEVWSTFSIPKVLFGNTMMSVAKTHKGDGEVAPKT